MPWAERVAAILQAWYPRQEAGHVVAEGSWARPSGAPGFPSPSPRWEDGANHGQDSEVQPGLDGRVRHEEGVFIGQRHHDRVDTPPLFPLGHRLSFTTFALSSLTVEANGEGARLGLTLTNTGDGEGSEVVQA